jgi:hypothetical protein
MASNRKDAIKLIDEAQAVGAANGWNMLDKLLYLVEISQRAALSPSSDDKELAVQDALNHGTGMYIQNPDGSTKHVPIDQWRDDKAGSEQEPKWDKTPPTEQGWYWHWNGDPDHQPVPTSVLYSGTTRTCFVSIGQLGITEAIFCDKYGGYWMRMHAPSVFQSASTHTDSKAPIDFETAWAAICDKGYAKDKECALMAWQAATRLPSQVPQWLPIESAPKDGSRIILLMGGYKPIFGYWCEQKYNSKPKPYWSCDQEHIMGVGWCRANQPTHWMPEPAAQ